MKIPRIMRSIAVSAVWLGLFLDPLMDASILSCGRFDACD
jgi:hypothetical protein